ncbi:MAG: NUMOD4 motif-containing HNH endonuclease [Lachnospiraceae bacterium]|nr:NUMOD4 motif-containing HNH endonuclease [Lachnospiraceae bacterium]
MDEIWHEIDGYSKYQVSNTGKVRNKETGNIIKAVKNPEGYLRITIRNDEGIVTTKAVHRLVAEAFVNNSNPLKYTMVNHIDQDRANAAASNLEWVTPKQNANHSNRNELIALSRETPINEYDRYGNYIRTWKSASRAANYYGVYKDGVTHAMAFNTFVKGRFFKKWSGTVHNIDLRGHICKSEQSDYSVFGPINPDDLFEAKSIDEQLNEIYERERSVESVTLPTMKADMAFLEQYVRRLERSTGKQRTIKESGFQIPNNIIPESNRSSDEDFVWRKPVKKHETGQAPIISFIEKEKIRFIDNRDKGGALWLIGGKELSEVVKKAGKLGYSFRFAPKGGKATNHQPGWWTKKR